MSFGGRTIREHERFEYMDEECEITILGAYTSSLINPEVVILAHATYNEETYFVEGTAIVSYSTETGKYHVDWPVGNGSHRSYHEFASAAGNVAIGNARLMAQENFKRKIDKARNDRHVKVRALDLVWKYITPQEENNA